VPTCIYCRSEKASGEFNREHVIPEAFGRFKNNLVLHNTVCSECNSRFANSIDLHLARFSAEGLERYRWGVKPAEDIKKFNYRNVRLEYDEGGDWKGLLCELIPGGGPDGLVLEPLTQVGFALTDAQGFKFYNADDFFASKWKKDPTINPSGGVRVYPISFHTRAKEHLEREGIVLTTWREDTIPVEHGQEITVSHRFQVTDDVRRVVAKVALNYVASVYGAETALRGEFDSIRRYVHTGFQPMLPVVGVNVPPWVYHPMMEEDKRPVVHWIIVRPDVTGDVFLGQVCLFGWMVYLIVLSFEATGLDGSGHFFNVSDLTAYKMPTGPKERFVDAFEGLDAQNG